MSEQESSAQKPKKVAGIAPVGTDRINPESDSAATASKAAEAADSPLTTKEFGGQKGPEPTRYGDWEKNGRCTDF